MPLRRPLVAFHRRGKALHLQKDVGVALQAGQLLEEGAPLQRAEGQRHRQRHLHGV